jgi:Peptidase family C25/FG-GAP-like repeat/Fibronectin type III domain
MIRRLGWGVGIVLTAALAASAHADATLERDFLFTRDQIHVVDRAGTTEVTADRGIAETTPGLPDLPALQQRVPLPEGMRVASIEIIGLETEPLGLHPRVATAIVPTHGLGPVVRSVPDAARYAAAGLEPAEPARIGLQGYEAGHGVAFVLAQPVRWDASTGQLEFVRRMRVRLHLVSDPGTPLKRERIVREWEPARELDPSARLADAAVTISEADAFGAATRAATAKGRRAQPFSATQVPSLLGSPVQYVIVTNDEMAPQFQRLADWKTRAGVPAVVGTMSFVRAQYPSGTDDADRLRQFLRDCYTRWATKWVLLGGDTDVIPFRLAHTQAFAGDDIPADLYYSCLDGNWNADGDSLYGEGASLTVAGDSADLVPEVFVGRAPTSTLAQAQIFVDKSLQYETTPPGTYETNDLFFAEVLFPQPWNQGDPVQLDGADLAEEVQPYIQHDTAVHVGKVYENYSAWPGTTQERRVTVLDSLNAGYNIAVHVGHGYRNVMSVGDDDLTNADMQGLTNGNRLINMYAIDCTSNAIDFPSIGEALLHAPNGGGVTNIGSTRLDFPQTGRNFQKEYFRLLYNDSVTAVGELQARQKYPFIGGSTFDNVNRWTETTLLLLGDPELHLWTGTPRTLSVSAPATFTLGDTLLTVHVQIGVTPLLNARVTAWKANDVFRSATTDGAGNVTLPFEPDSTGSFLLTVTAYDARPYQATIPIVVGGKAQLAEQPLTVDDDNLSGTSGNSNGVWDAGETVDLHVPLRNNGGASAGSVIGTIATTDGAVSILLPSLAYGTIAPGATSSPSFGFRVSIPYTTPDQREIPFTLTLTDAAGDHQLETFQITTRAPDLRHYSHTLVDVGGTPDGYPDAGETITYTVKLTNRGTGIAPGVTGVLRSLDGLCVVSDSTATWGDIAPGQEKGADSFTFLVNDSNGKLQLRLTDAYGLLSTQTLDLNYPGPPYNVAATGAGTTVTLTWGHNTDADLLGYNVYQSTSLFGPYVKSSPVPADRTSYALDQNLAPLTHYYFRVTAVDSSGNESAQSFFADAITSPPSHAVFPVAMGRNTPAPVAVDHIYSGYPLDIVAGSEVLYVFHPDGSAPLDADGLGTSLGDFTTRGLYYAAGASIADLDGDGNKEIVGVTWDSLRAYTFDQQGHVRPGWPVVTGDVWSSAAVGDLNHDGNKEIVFGSNSQNFYVLRANGTDWIDGDSNPSTIGVFKVLGGSFNYSSPALADLLGNGQTDIIMGGSDGNLYAWRPDGTNLPGFPVHVNQGFTSSPAVGYLDGPGDTSPEIVIAPKNDSLYVFTNTGQRRPGWPVNVFTAGTSKTPSPALADMNNDGFLDIVFASTDGFVHVYDRNANPLAPVNGKQFNALFGYASESSPVVADINGDGYNDVVIGGEDATLTAISGLNGATLPGFPIPLNGEVRGTPALCDCDGDGKTEIVLADWDKNLYMWDYDFPFSPNGPPPWPQFHHDAARTGFASNPVFVDVDPAQGLAPRAVEFAPPQPNPANRGARVQWAVPADRAGAPLDVAVFDLSGRRVQTLASGVAKSGRFSVEWNLRDAHGASAAAGVYFLHLRLGSEARTQRLVVLH